MKLWKQKKNEKFYEIKIFDTNTKNFENFFIIIFWKKTWKVHWYFLKRFWENLIQKQIIFIYRPSNNIENEYIK